MKKQTPIKFKRGDKIKIIKDWRPYYRKGDIGKVISQIDSIVYNVNFRKLNKKWYGEGGWAVLAKNMVKA